MPDPYLALALSGSQLVELASDGELVARWDATPLAFTVLGLDRIDGTPPGRVTLAGTAVAAQLAQRTSGARFLVAATPQRDHPYNLARRIVSLGHLSRGRSGVLVGVADSYAPTGPDHGPAWGGANLGAGAPLTGQTAVAAAHAISTLEQSWPFEALVGDREEGILVRANQISHIDLEGAFDIAGPLTLPAPRTGPSIVGLLSEAPGDSVSDLRIGAGGDVEIVDATAALTADAVHNTLIRPAPDQPLSEVLDDVDRLLSGTGFRPIEPGTALRTALEREVAQPLKHGLRPAFPVPQPYPSL